MSYGLILYLLVNPKCALGMVMKEAILLSKTDIDARVVISHDPMYMTIGMMQTVGSFLT